MNDLRVYQAKTMSWLPGVVQGFTTRSGGVSEGAFTSLNLSYAVGDDPGRVELNRQRLASAVSVSPDSLLFAEQVHGNLVAVVNNESTRPVGGVDSLVTCVPDLVLTLLFADCFPVYFVDPVKKVVALAHSGWKGSAGNIVQETTNVLTRQFDVNPRMCQVAIGPGIGGESYEVGPEVAEVFRESNASGSSVPVVLRSEWESKWELHLRRVIFSQLLTAGFRAESIAVCDEDTFRNSRDFFSHRRESLHNRKTGRMAAFLGLV